jgi:hypothetical protein
MAALFTIVADDWDCLVYQITVDLAAFDDQDQELDRYTGTLPTAVGADEYGGTLTSRENDWTFR